MSNADFLKTTADVRLSLSDWLLLLGWASAHITEATPILIINTTREIGKQVQA
jgi:hypothetical protein